MLSSLILSNGGLNALAMENEIPSLENTTLTEEKTVPSSPELETETDENQESVPQKEGEETASSPEEASENLPEEELPESRENLPSSEEPFQENQPLQAALEEQNITLDTSLRALKDEWSWTQNGDTITLMEYIGSSPNVIIPTAKDLGQDGTKVYISREVLNKTTNGRTSLETSLNGDKIIVSSSSLSGVFQERGWIKSLQTIQLRNLDVSNVTNMEFMFWGCRNLSALDISNWDVSNVTNMEYMFYNCPNLIFFDLSNWQVAETANINWMFLRFDKPILVKTTDERLLTYNYSGNGCTKLGTVTVDSQYGEFKGSQNTTSLFDYTTSLDFNDALVEQQLNLRKEALKLNPDYEFEAWEPQGSYTTLLEKANGTYRVKVKDNFCIIIPKEYSLSNKQPYAQNNVSMVELKKPEKAYSGLQKVKVTIKSQNNFNLGSQEEILAGNYGQYHLVDQNKQDVPINGFVLDKRKNVQAVNAELTRKATDNVVANDFLTFSYERQ
ncbi:surface protein [Lactococcus garvieae]|uniref:Surface protein n=2 Tax=Lactococcus garvieae TaxID=1363 RepID=A0A1I4J3Z6_9LACT|nr:surface protein [Lactococcus garvieae]